MNAKEPGQPKKKKDLRVIVLSILLFAAVVVIALLCLKTFNNTSPEEHTPDVIGGGEPITEEMNKEKDMVSTHLPAYGELTFASGTKEQTVVLKNPGENTCLIRISLILADGTTIYQSELIKPGYYSRPITLVAPMEQGLYRDVTMQYECFTDDEAYTPLNGATAKLDIAVK